MRASLLYITRDSFRPLISFFPLFFVEKFDAFWKRSIIVVRTRVMVDNILQVLASLKSILFYPPGAVQMEFLKAGAFQAITGAWPRDNPKYFADFFES